MDCINQRGYSSITDQYNDFIAATTSAETQQMPESYTIYLHQSCLYIRYLHFHLHQDLSLFISIKSFSFFRSYCTLFHSARFWHFAWTVGCVTSCSLFNDFPIFVDVPNIHGFLKQLSA